MTRSTAALTTLAVAPLLMPLAGCDPKHDPDRLVKRTDFDLSPTWAQRKVCGYDFLPQFGAVSYWTGAWRKDAPLEMYRECADAVPGIDKLKRNDIVSGRNANAGDYANWTKPEEKRTKPYTFEEVFGAKLKTQDSPLRKDYPFFLSFADDRPSFFLNRDYPLADRASYLKWRDAHPGFAGIRTLGEYDQQAQAYRAYSTRNNDKTVTEHLRKSFPFPPKGTPEMLFRRDWFPKWARECFAREVAYSFGETNLWAMCSGTPSLSLVFGEIGANGVLYEATTQGPGSWTIPGAYLRGAARQFGVPYGWYTANFISGYTRDGTFGPGENSMALDAGKRRKTEGKCKGASRSTINRQNTYGWLIGASVVEPENWYLYHMEQVKQGEGADMKSENYVPSMYARDLQELCDRAKSTDRGICYTPLAVLVPVWELSVRGYGNGGSCDPWSMNAVGLTLEPINADQNDKLYDLQRRNGDEACFLNSPFGGIYDIVAPDATRNRANVGRTLGAYKAAIVAGDFRKNELPAGVFEDYAAQGGTLFVSGDKLVNGIVNPAAAGVSFGAKTAASGKALFDARRNEKACDLTLGYDVMLPEGAPTAQPLCRDELGNVIVWSKDYGKGRIVTVACDRMLPSAYAKGKRDNKAYNALLLAAAKPGFRFDILHALLAKVQDETMPVKVDGDVMWGVNRTAKGWLVWMFNNKGVTKFIGEPQQLDMSKTAQVTVRCGGRAKAATVAPGGIAYVNFED